VSRDSTYLEVSRYTKYPTDQWGGGNCKGPTGGGFDCSGLLSWAVCQVTGRDLFSEGLRVTRTMYCASETKLKYKKVEWNSRQAGDAVFFGGKCDCENNPAGIHHVGLMMDDGFTMFNALKTGTKIRTDNFKNWSEKACPYVIRFE
jgi:cell wall-associated NlpC family hydrolase